MSDEQAATRQIDELLNLDTYQGMTDDEIETLIAYKCKLEYYRGLSDQATSANDTFMAEQLRLARKAVEAAEATRDEVRANPPAFRSVKYDG